MTVLPFFEPRGDVYFARWVRAVRRVLAGSVRVTYRHKGTGNHDVGLPDSVASRPVAVRVLSTRPVSDDEGGRSTGNRIFWVYKGDHIEVQALDDLNASLTYEVTLEIVTE